MSYNDTILADLPGTGSYWKLDEASGNVTDSGGGAHNGTVAGSPTYRFGGPITLDSPNFAIGTFAGNDGFDCGDSFEFTGTASFSVECWVYPTIRDAAARYLMSQRSGGAEGWDWLINGTSALLFRRFQASATDDLTTATLPPLNAYSHLVTTYDSTNLRGYLNAVLVAGPTASAKSIQVNAATFQLCGGGPGNLGGYQGRPAVYPGVVLTLAQIQTHYQVGVQAGRANFVDLPFM